VFTQFTALLDSSVLYSAPLRDLLLQLAYSDLFRGKWTDQIHDEWTSNLLKNRPDISPKHLELTRTKINGAVLDCLVTGYEPFIDGFTLPDPDDRHVLAAAVRAQAQIIVTYNLKDFPSRELAKHDIEAQHPDTFLRHQIDLSPPRFLSSVKAVRNRLKAPPITAEEYFDILIFQNLPQTANFLKQYANLI
jgi:predicted nucleic acid-binding protein